MQLCYCPCSAHNKLTFGLGEQLNDQETCYQVWQPEFDPWNPHSARREPSPVNCPLTYTHSAVLCMQAHKSMFKTKQKPAW